MLNLKPINVSDSSVVVDEDEGILRDYENQPLSPMARMFHEPDSNVYIITMIGFNSKLDPQVIKANLHHSSFLKHPRFSSLQVVDEKKKGGLKWVPTKVNLDDHVIVPNLEPIIKLRDSSSLALGEGEAEADRFVEDYASNLSKTGVRMSIPMWDIHLLNIKTSDAESVGVLRVHHSLGDGTSLMSLLLSCTRKVSNPEELPAIVSINNPRNKKLSAAADDDDDDSNKSMMSMSMMINYLIMSVILLLKYYLRLFWNTLVDVVMFIATAFMLIKDTKTPLKINGGHQLGKFRCGPRSRRFVHRSVSLLDVKLVKNAMKTTINDVMLGVTQAGLSRYLNRKYGEINNNKGFKVRNNNLPENIRLRATFFMNLRPAAGIQELGNMLKKGSKAKWGNKIGYVIFPFTIALRDNPLDYLREAKAAMDKKKASLEANFSYFISKYFLKFGFKGASFPSETTLWFSNVMGPQEEISLYGYPIAYIAPSCCGQSNGLMIHVVSYANKMRFILSVDDDLITNPHQLCDDLEESLNLIKSSVIAQGLA